MATELSRRGLLKGGVSVGALGLGGAASPLLGSTAHAALKASRGRTWAYTDLGGPRGVALGFPDANAQGTTVTWFTSGSVDPGTVIRYGVVPDGARDGQLYRALTDVRAGSSHPAPYGEGNLGHPSFGQPTDGELPVLVHRVQLPTFPRGSTVAYQVGAGDQWTPVRTFRPGIGDQAGFTLAHVGDHGRNVASHRTTAAIAALAPNAVVIAGDLSYANGTQPHWDTWASRAEALTGSVPLLPTAGNHESKDFNGDTYRARFAHPNPGRAWYSIDLHNVHLLSNTAGAFLRAEDPQAAGELVRDELTWMERDLAAAAARRAAGALDFIVVTQHFPLYTDHRTRGPVSAAHVAAQEQLFQRYGVDLLLVGHDHMYQRSKPMAYGVPTTEGAGYVQVCAGAGGQSLYEFTPVGTTETEIDGEQPWQRWSLWSEAWARQFSFVTYRVAGDTIEATAYGWDDVEGQNDIPTDPDTYDNDLVWVDPNAVDPDLAPRVLDRFRLLRKPPAAILAAAAQEPTLAAELLATLPEANGIVVENAAEDCTLHEH